MQRSAHAAGVKHVKQGSDPHLAEVRREKGRVTEMNPPRLNIKQKANVERRHSRGGGIERKLYGVISLMHEKGIL